MADRQLSTEVAAKYQLSGIKNANRRQFAGYGTIDLSTISIKQADDLVALKFPFLEAVKPAKSKQTAPPVAEDANPPTVVTA